MPSSFALQSQIRRRALSARLRAAAAEARYNNAAALGVMASPPTITTGTSSLDGTLTKIYRTNSGQASSFTVTGGLSQQATGGFAAFRIAPAVTMPAGSGGNTAGLTNMNTYQWSVEFMTDAPKVQLRYLNATTVYMVEVDNQPVSASGLAYPSTSSTGFTLLDFGSSRVRRIRVEFVNASGWDGAYVGPTYSIWPVESATALRVVTVGDSIDAGTANTLPNGSWQKVAGKMLGWTDVRQVSFGGSGFVTAGSYNIIGAALRVADALSHTPDLLIISGSQNDDGVSGATVTAAALTALQAYRAALPNAPIVVVGVDASSSGPSAARLTNEAAVLSAFTSWADTNSFYIPVSNDPSGSWEYGTGTTGATAGSGNRDRFGSDVAHPNDAGHSYIAQRFANGFRTKVLAAMP